MTMMAAYYNPKRVVYCQRVGIVPAPRPKWAELPLPTAIRSENRARVLGKAASC
jgi:hypothetical protein